MTTIPVLHDLDAVEDAIEQAFDDFVEWRGANPDNEPVDDATLRAEFTAMVRRTIG